MCKFGSLNISLFFATLILVFPLQILSFTLVAKFRIQQLGVKESVARMITSAGLDKFRKSTFNASISFHKTPPDIYARKRSIFAKVFQLKPINYLTSYFQFDPIIFIPVNQTHDEEYSFLSFPSHLYLLIQFPMDQYPDSHYSCSIKLNQTILETSIGNGSNCTEWKEVTLHNPSCGSTLILDGDWIELLQFNLISACTSFNFSGKRCEICKHRNQLDGNRKNSTDIIAKESLSIPECGNKCSPIFEGWFNGYSCVSVNLAIRLLHYESKINKFLLKSKSIQSPPPFCVVLCNGHKLFFSASEALRQSCILTCKNVSYTQSEIMNQRGGELYITFSIKEWPDESPVLYFFDGSTHFDFEISSLSNEPLWIESFEPVEKSNLFFNHSW